MQNQRLDPGRKNQYTSFSWYWNDGSNHKHLKLSCCNLLVAVCHAGHHGQIDSIIWVVSNHPFFERQVFLNASGSPSSEVHPRKQVHHDGAHSTPLHQKNTDIPFLQPTLETNQPNSISNPKLQKKKPCVNIAWCIGWLATTQPKTPSSAQQPKPGISSSAVIGTTHTGNASPSLATARPSHPHYLDGVKIVWMRKVCREPSRNSRTKMRKIKPEKVEKGWLGRFRVQEVKAKGKCSVSVRREGLQIIL